MSYETLLSKWKDQTVYVLQNCDRVVQRQTLGVGNNRLGLSDNINDNNLNAKARKAELQREPKPESPLEAIDYVEYCK